jgi:hypothetical protein
MEATAGCFWRLDRFICIPQNFELRLKLIFELRDSSSTGHIGVAATLAKALDRFWWKRVHQDVKHIVGAASCVDEQRFNHIWLRLFTPYVFHLDRGTQLDLTT